MPDRDVAARPLAEPAIDTLCTHPPGPRDDTALVPPIPYTTTFVASDAAAFARMASQPRHPRYYTRYGNPLHAQLAEQVVALEAGADAARYAGLVTGSGMAAISTALWGLLKAGDHVVAQTNHYMGTAKSIGELLPRFGVACTLVDQTDTAAFAAAMRPATRLVMVETPVNPTCAITDLEAVAAIARAHGAICVCDNTFASPVNQRPLALGVDVVVHSATKYLSGHHDATAGVVVARRDLIDALWKAQICLGGTLSPMDAFLVMRGIRTLALRVRRQNEVAMTLARWLEGHPKVERVLYPGLPSHPQHVLAARQMSGFGGVMNLLVRGDFASTARFVQSLALPAQAVSLGGVESLVVHAAAMWAGTMTDAEMQVAGIAPNSVRLSVGIEAVEDLQADLDQALQAL